VSACGKRKVATAVMWVLHFIPHDDAVAASPSYFIARR